MLITFLEVTKFSGCVTGFPVIITDKQKQHHHSCLAVRFIIQCDLNEEFFSNHGEIEFYI